MWCSRAGGSSGCKKTQEISRHGAVILSARTEDSRRGEAKNLSWFGCRHFDRRGILRFAQNDNLKHLLRGLIRLGRLVAVQLRFLLSLTPQAKACATLLLVLLAAGPVFATTYFVAAAGSDSNSGTDALHPWQTVAKVNGAAFSAGDSVLFNRGDAWYGTSLVVPSSGSSGSPITFGAYGSGVNPMLKGSTFLNTSGFALAPNLIATVFSLHDSGTFSNDSLTRNWREQIGAVQITNSVISLTVTVMASPSAALNITGAAIGPVSTAPNTSAMTRITWGGGNNGVTVAAGTSATSDVITYSLNNSVDQIVAIYTTARNVEYFGNNNTTLWSDNTAADQSQASNVTGDGFAAGGNSVVGSIVGTIQTTFTYRQALGTAPVAVWENGTLLLSKNSQSAAEAFAGSWFYDGTYLYLHASDGSNIAANGKTYSYVTASSPTFTAWDNGKSWLIFDSLDQSETYNTSTATLGGLYLTGSNSIVRNLSLHDTYRHPLTVYIGAANNVVTNVIAYHAYGTSPLAIYGPGTTGNLVQNSSFYNDTSLSSAYLPAGVWAVVVAHGGSTANVVDSCLIYSTAPSPGGYGLLIGDSGTAVTFSHNFIYGTYAYAVDVGNGGGDGLGTGAMLTLWDNLIDTSQASNTGILFSGSVGSAVYNNTIFGPGNSLPAISQTSTSTGTLVKNNIFYTGSYASVDASSETGTVYDYNDYFSAGGSPFSWGGTSYTFSGWQGAAVQDAHSLSLDPGLANASSLSSTGNFSLLAVSPAINAGVNLGSTYQMGLSPAASWPGGVSLLNQNSAGSGWEIGGYVYPANALPTLLLRGCCD
jgi:hypothetical protein